MNPISRALLSISIGIVIVILPGCAPRERPVDAAMREGLLLLGNGPEPQSLDPHVTTGTSELNIQMALYEGLVSPHPDTLEPVPGVAESWTVSGDGRKYRFQLRESARWSDGKDITSADFIAAWKRALDPAQGTPYASMLYVLRGAEAFNRGAVEDFGAVGVRSISDHVLEVELDHPVPYFLSLLLHPVWYPIPAHLFSGQYTGNRSGSWTTMEAFVGNGPFVLSDWKPGQFVEAERSSSYWDAGQVQLERIRFMAIDEPAAEERAFLSGQLHVTDALPPARVRAYQESNSPFLRIDPYLGTYYILLNTRLDPLSRSKVRKALSLAVDKEAIAGTLLGAGQVPAAGFVPENLPRYDSSLQLEYDPDRAREFLAEAGFPDGKGFPVLEYLFNSSESHRLIAEALQAMWRKELGIQVNLTNQEWRTYLQRRASGDFELARAVWIGDYVEPSTFLDLWQTGSGNNWAGWSNPEYDRLLERAHSTSNLQERMELYAQAESILINEQAIIPLYFYVTVYLKQPVLKGWAPNLLDWHPVKYLSFSGI